MNDRKFWTIFGLIFVLATAGSAYAIYAKQENITQRRDEVARLGTDIQTARKTITTTASLEKEVIVLRELSAVFEEILPTTDGARNLIKNFYNYSRETGVQPTSFQPQASRTPARGEQSDFDRFSYTLEMTGDTFQFLDFINRIETHSRFMSIPSFKLTAGSRKEMEQTGSARHAIQMDVETYVYQPKTEAQRVPIDGYDRKRDLLVGEINRRRQALRLQTFQFRGSRGRRDPWIDPRVSVDENSNGLTMIEQKEKVDELIELLKSANAQWARVDDAENILERMMEKRGVIEAIATIQDELRRIDNDGLVTYPPAAKRLQLEVRDPLRKLQTLVDDTKSLQGPLKEELEQVVNHMRTNIEAGDFLLAIQDFESIKSGLELVQGDPGRMELADELRRLAEEADILRAFGAIDITFGGQALIEGHAPAVLLNGKTLSVGDLLQPGVEVVAIRPFEVDFAFRGVVLTRSF
ncbi:MAG: type 4a pilus biogenesis protein PilO [Planctomycetes bacterium]|nr:type 4a pilus biogenesis protein PilO [Planctomycetota bacterium]MCB9910407.1 type 4a pilus biogenesis protein PilO [Planctomycetota bacterium]HPF13801.1 type 4a pilus biogenesis protein PilO [Planctomycetota bacterium]HRV79831.1 type 4a pilus biogenesis protein PilO [Planctomycetota bacterium]